MNNIAFVVGCEEYDNVDNLEGVNNDVASMQSALIDHCGCLHENVYIISNQPNSACEPTVTKILNLIVQKSKNYSSESIENLFFYFSGHGYLSAQNKVCLVLKDSIISPITVGTVEVETIISALKQFDNVNHIILFLDICQNEIMAKGVIGDQIISSDYFPQGVVIFFSCFPKNHSYMIPQEVYNKYGKGSVFTKCLVDSLQPQNKCQSVKEISAYLKKNVTNLSSQLGFEQKPYTQTEDISLNDVIISLNSASEKNADTYMTTRTGNEYLLDSIVTSIQVQYNLLDIFNSFSGFVENDAETNLSKLSYDISKYTRIVELNKNRIRCDINIPVLATRYILDLKKSTTEFREKWETHYANISMSVKKLEEYDDCALHYINKFESSILKIESVLNEISMEKAEELKEKTSTMREYMSSYKKFYLHILKYRNYYKPILLKIKDLPELFAPVENSKTLNNMNDQDNFLLLIDKIVKKLFPLKHTILDCQISMSYDKRRILNTMGKFNSRQYNDIFEFY